MGELSEREQAVLIARYGFEDGVEKTLEEVGQTFGVTRERIRQIESKALRKLSHPTRIRELKDFISNALCKASVALSVFLSARYTLDRLL